MKIALPKVRKQIADLIPPLITTTIQNNNIKYIHSLWCVLHSFKHFTYPYSLRSYVVTQLPAT